MGPTGIADRAERARAQRSRRIIVGALVLVMVVALGAGAIAIWTFLGNKSATPSACQVTAGSSRYTIDVAQAANATTITAVGKRLGLLDHAVTIALAAALQESQLRNISYGDRDSLGLFQQRPSQGWGSAAQVMRPGYAASAFFKALERIPGWQAMSVTDAAQAVQHSDAPKAYAVWEPLARTLAIATTGEAAAGLTCEFPISRNRMSPLSPMPQLTNELGPAALDAPVSRARGWTVASWLVAHAQQYRISRVSFAGRQWTPAGTWSPDGTSRPGVGITQVGQ